MLHPDVREAVELAYRWEVLAARAAREGLAYPQPLPLEQMLGLAEANAHDLGAVLDAASLARPEVPEMPWTETLVALSRGHPGVHALSRASHEFDASLLPLVARLEASGAVHREAALEALTRVRPMS